MTTNNPYPTDESDEHNNGVIEFSIKGYQCLISSQDSDLLELWWTPFKAKFTDTVYLSRTSNGINIQIHRTILGRVLGRPLLSSELVDHRDGNGLNNTRENLRLATHAQNVWNSAVQKRNKLGTKGVSQVGRKFVAQIGIKGKPRYLGVFSTVEEAQAAYMDAARLHYGEFATDGNRKYRVHKTIDVLNTPQSRAIERRLLRTWELLNEEPRTANTLDNMSFIEQMLGYTPTPPARTQERSAR